MKLFVSLLLIISGTIAATWAGIEMWNIIEYEQEIRDNKLLSKVQDTLKSIGIENEDRQEDKLLFLAILAAGVVSSILGLLLIRAK